MTTGSQIRVLRKRCELRLPSARSLVEVPSFADESTAVADRTKREGAILDDFERGLFMQPGLSKLVVGENSASRQKLKT